MDAEQAALDKLKAMANRGAMQMLKMTLLGMVKVHCTPIDRN